MRLHWPAFLVLLVSGCGGDRGVNSDVPSSGGTTGTISTDGGTVALEGVGEVTFGVDTFAEPEAVTLLTTADAAVAHGYEHGAAIFLPGARSPYEVRLLTENSEPLVDFELRLDVPDELSQLDPAAWQVEILGQVYATNELETHDDFELIPSTLDGDRLVAAVPVGFFTSQRRADGRPEALFVLVALPRSIPGRSQPLEESEGCAGALIGPPLDGEINDACKGGSEPCVFRGFHRVVSCPTRACESGQRYHGGVDYSVDVGTTVFAASDGQVMVKDEGPNKGYGLYVILSGSNGQTLYGHLSETLVANGATVTRGTAIAKTGNSGHSTGPHLHFDYAPKGGVYAVCEVGRQCQRVDPVPCLAPDLPFDPVAQLPGAVDAVWMLDLQTVRVQNDPAGELVRSVDYHITGTFTTFLALLDSRDGAMNVRATWVERTSDNPRCTLTRNVDTSGNCIRLAFRSPRFTGFPHWSVEIVNGVCDFGNLTMPCRDSLGRPIQAGMLGFLLQFDVDRRFNSVFQSAGEFCRNESSVQILPTGPSIRLHQTCRSEDPETGTLTWETMMTLQRVE